MGLTLGQFARTTVNFTLGDGTLYQNVYHHRRVGVGIFTDAAIVAAINTWVTAMYGEVASHVSDGITENLASVDRVAFVVDGWQVAENLGTFTWTFTPTATAVTRMPNQISPFVTFKTARPKTVGRKFLFPMTEGDFASGVILGSLVTAIVAYADDAVNNCVISVPLDYLVPGVVRVGVDSFEDFTMAIVTNLAGTQRRRRLGEGA